MDPHEPPDPLSELRDRLRETREAAARLADDPPRVPPQGWASPGSGSAGGGSGGGGWGGGGSGGGGSGADPGLGDELQQLVAMIASLRELVPPELQQQVTDLIRQVLVLLRAILDRWIERLEPGRGSEPDVEDIPIS